MKKKLIAAVTALAMVASTGSIVFADEAVDYDVENHEFKDVTITLHTRWDEADISGPLYQDIVNGFMEKYPGITVECINIPTESEWLNSESVLMSGREFYAKYHSGEPLRFPLQGYIEQDLIVDMTPYYEQYPEWKARFNAMGESLTDFLNIWINEGSCYGIPFTVYQVMLFL